MKYKKQKAIWNEEMQRLASIAYTGEDFEPLIKAKRFTYDTRIYKINRWKNYTNSSTCDN